MDQGYRPAKLHTEEMDEVPISVNEVKLLMRFARGAQPYDSDGFWRFPGGHGMVDNDAMSSLMEKGLIVEDVEERTEKVRGKIEKRHLETLRVSEAGWKVIATLKTQGH